MLICIKYYCRFKINEMVINMLYVVRDMLTCNNYNNKNNNNSIFFIYKLLTPLANQGSKPTCPTG